MLVVLGATRARSPTAHAPCALLQELRDLYPEFHEFVRIREELDPKGMFLNGYLERLLA